MPRCDSTIGAASHSAPSGVSPQDSVRTYRCTRRRHILVPYTLCRATMSITSVFTNNRSQAVRLPADARLPEGVKKVLVRARGVDRIISPVGHTWDEFFLSGPRASEDFMSQAASQQQAEREAL